MLKELEAGIVRILSHERSENPAQPAAVGKARLKNRMTKNKPPNMTDDAFQEELEKALERLLNMREILSGQRYYCMAPPTLIANSKEECINGLKFLGDRAYLKLVHQKLRSSSSPESTSIPAGNRKFERIQEKLNSLGVRILTIDDLTAKLQAPKIPPSYLLQCPIDLLVENLELYQSTPHTSQDNRWYPYQGELLAEPGILRRSRKNCFSQAEYWWWDGSQAYSLDSEVAILAMFAQDQEKQALVMIAHPDVGILKLQDVFLPYSYMQYIWQLSEEGSEYRTRRIPSGRWQLIESALKQLGCQFQ